MRFGVTCEFIGGVLTAAAVFVACDSDSPDQDALSGSGAGASGSSGSVGNASGAGEAGAPAVEASQPLPFNRGTVENSDLGVQGVVFAESDPHTAESMTSNLTDPAQASSKACIKGVAAKVDMASTICATKMFTPPATDCFGEFWGADIGMQLKQAPESEPEPFDASALKGFSFEIEGETVPPVAALRFQVEAADRVFCSSRSVNITPGFNRVLFSQLIEDCFLYPSDPSRASAEELKSELLKISWRVTTNSTGAVPFNFCVSNLAVLLN